MQLTDDLTLILGGARSGKSAYARRLAETSNRACIMIATAEPLDAEMEQRIEAHRAERDPCWTVLEEPVDISQVIREHTCSENIVVVDCLTLWLSNIIHRRSNMGNAQRDLIEALEQRCGPTILVSNEVGLGLVPETELGRSFRDHQGRLNQRIAKFADHVMFLAAGLPLALKGNADDVFARDH